MRASTTFSVRECRSQLAYRSFRCQSHSVAPAPLCHPATRLVGRSKFPSWLRGCDCQWQALTRKGSGGRYLSRGRKAVCPVALVAVEWNPAVFIGLGLVGGGLVLYQLRSLRPELSRDFDIVASSVLIFSGGILITQVRSSAVHGITYINTYCNHRGCRFFECLRRTINFLTTRGVPGS